MTNGTEWEIIAHDEKNVMDEQVDYYIDHFLEEEGYSLLYTETHYSYKNFQWETLVTFTSK